MKNINFKIGFRRIVIFLICIIFVLSCTIISFDINSTVASKFYTNTLQINNDKKISIEEKTRNVYKRYKKTFYIDNEYSCNYWQRVCTVEIYFKNPSTLEKTVIEKNIYKESQMVEMPSLLNVLWWYIEPYLLAIFWCTVLYLIYLLLEFSIIWIIKGFKGEKVEINIHLPQISKNTKRIQHKNLDIKSLLGPFKNKIKAYKRLLNWRKIRKNKSFENNFLNKGIYKR